MTERTNLDRAEQREPLSVAKLDLQIVRALSPYKDHAVVRMVGDLSDLADQPPLVASSLILAGIGLARKDRRLARTGLRMLASHALATAVKTVIKNSVDRSRPGKAAEEGDHRFEPGDSDDGEDRSFPSGHTAGAFAAARAIVRDYPDTAVPLYLAAGVAAGIQVPRHAHYPSDLLAGAVIGISSEWVVNGGLRLLTQQR